MKIIIDADSLHMLLTADEVEQFAHEGMVKQRVVLDEEPLVYILQRTTEEVLRATLHTNLITLLVPEALADKWVQDGETKIEGDNAGMRIVVEKDATA